MFIKETSITRQCILEEDMCEWTEMCMKVNGKDDYVMGVEKYENEYLI